jgi:sugar/nucleoside kinase (ribokinase family)/phosphoglycolate phosphatase-like HAD superfamily hydrolase
MTGAELDKLLDDLRNVRVAVVGDFCLDVYWLTDLAASEPSLETGKAAWPVRASRAAPGGAGTVVNNLVAAGCREVRALGIVGDDPWGRELRRLLREAGVNADGMAEQRERWTTLAYVKPYLGDVEQNRLDFGNFNALSDPTADILLRRLEALLPSVHAVVVNEQVRQGIHTPYFRRALAGLIQQHPKTLFIADSRHFGDAYPGACLKLNAHEAARLAGIQRPPDEPVLRSEAAQAADRLFERQKRPVFITRGPRGALVRDESGLHEIPAIQVLGPTDTVGAGDSVLAGIALGLAAGRTPPEAATLGMFIAGVTIQKLRQTGAASPEEIRAIGRDPNFEYRVDLAGDERHARTIEGTEFEIITEVLRNWRVTHAIFDQDGTLSTLRQGWEHIMEPVMIKAILGPRYDSADESLYRKVVKRVRDFIEKSTGIQTLIQMQGLVAMVKEFGCVPAAEILDEFGYKRIYNDALMEVVNQRLAKLRRGELSRDDFVIRNAVETVRRLHAAGVVLYLASGTDEHDVVAEAKALGYAELFTGGICGSVGDVTKDAKKIVLDRILREIGPSAVRGLVTFGDGPVEIRETHKRGGFTIGVASDEVRRFGFNPAKRPRLVMAGADMIIPDFSQMDRLLPLLGI